MLRLTIISTSLLIACGLVGCTSPRVLEINRGGGTTVEEIQRASAGIVGCRPETIVVDDAHHAEFHDVWTLTCRSGRWICSRQDVPTQEYINCSRLADELSLSQR